MHKNRFREDNFIIFYSLKGIQKLSSLALSNNMPNQQFGATASAVQGGLDIFLEHCDHLIHTNAGNPVETYNPINGFLIRSSVN